MNDKFVHVQGPFSAGDDIVSYIKSNYDPDFLYVKDCGIQAPLSHYVEVNGVMCEIGKSRILEYKDVKITSLCFSQDESELASVDCILE